MNYPKFFEGRIKSSLDKAKMGRPSYITTHLKSGQVFGCFTICDGVEPVRIINSNNNKNKTTYYVYAQCSCGKKSWVRGSALRSKQKCCKYCRSVVRNGMFKKLTPEMKYWHKYAYMLRKSAKKRGLCFDLTPEYLQKIYQKQKGICAISGIVIGREIGNISVDRIDNSLGYIKGNIQFADLGVNKLKFDMSMSELVELCKKIVYHNTQ